MMTQNDYVEMLRRSRGKRSVLKLKLVTLRGKSPNTLIFVFEGDDDKIVYNRWLSRVGLNAHYHAFVCKGKGGVSIIQDITIKDMGDLADKIYLFIDRDFDDDRAFVPSDRLFMTDMYSVENYLVSPDVITSILRDEFPCHEEFDLAENIKENFVSDYRDFINHTTEINERLYVYRVLDLPIPRSLPTSISDYANVQISNITPSASNIDELLPRIQAISRPLDTKIRDDFATLDGFCRYRGKNAYMFFTRWINLLCDHFDQKAGVFSGTDIKGRVRRPELTLGGFASKSPLPSGLAAFVDQIPS